jgi:lipoprotein-anchoring transpeptidase ErfK/SrfK
MMTVSRRAVLISASSLGALALAGCNANQQIAASTPVYPAPPAPAAAVAEEDIPTGDWDRASFEAAYGPIADAKFPIPGVQWSQVNHAFLRKVVDYPSPEDAGTIVVDPHRHYLFHIMGGGRAMRYGVGVGRQGFAWAGAAMIHNKQEWPDWYPPSDMFERQPEIKKVMAHLQSGLGMHGGPGNPLGARAMYLWQGDKDTLYRIHGTIEPGSIGQSVSSGCIRMINQDALDLYNRTPVGTKVIVLG